MKGVELLRVIANRSGNIFQDIGEFQITEPHMLNSDTKKITLRFGYWEMIDRVKLENIMHPAKVLENYTEYDEQKDKYYYEISL